MDNYGIDIKGDVTVGTDNTYDMGGVATRLKSVYAVSFEGTSTSSKWADLAEKYLCKGECSVGTVMSVSSDVEADVEACQMDLDPSYVGVISGKPGYKMNSNLHKGEYVGLVGRLPIRVVGSISKKDFLVPTVGGCARAGKADEVAHKIGVALEEKLDPTEKIVECIIK